MNLPRVLIVSTKEGKAKEIAENIGAERLSEEDDIVDYLWDIDNKYYTSQILVRTIESISYKIPVEGINALIVYHDPQANNADQELEYLASLTNSLTAEVFLFSCNTITDTLLRDKVLNWCLHNKFELVELDQTGDSESDTEDKPCVDETHEVSEIGEQFENIRLTRDPSERLHMQDILDGILGDENADFGELFGQFMAMKEQAASLPSNERRVMAEQVVTAFWKAMGGDLLEIED
ncbi:alpha- and gamma-adaptin-binding protein p34 [Lasius niger]|uniref:Alpha-and gamma-adaptin-binding protein p34 n=1 Tax=Lasius niger TaxID=67767 RepID=A0A0J7L186_LASNI|nr:alpha- and gamma-adaptin-binding protein p34 [Lasius niger]